MEKKTKVIKKDSKPHEAFCTECGELLIRVPVPAEKAYYIAEFGCGNFYSVALGTRYSTFTGMRQFGIRVKCLNATGFWFNRHTSYIKEDSLHESDLPELLKL